MVDDNDDIIDKFKDIDHSKEIEELQKPKEPKIVKASVYKSGHDTKLVYDMEFGLNLFVLQILCKNGIMQKKTYDMTTEFVFSKKALSQKEKQILERFFGGMANKTGLVFENTIA